ncbi:L-ribulose-5-phosphate 3-epimerase UlaE [Planctomycetes bacterium Pan216]|uniref:L-ribulose-5-phosphate 3-epimerase UlaE n=1 Tax=Kolteria novifilia TaxID=2527975 RepID=A0A518AYF4_9BACT|nr:L-ribulose-5-phosphate 3-epimerase UlaE [Planctomycetes bacterium Pan216]
MLLGYNTNGFAHHRFEDTLAILADLGYGAVGITLDVHCLDPFQRETMNQLGAIRKRLESLGLRSVIETGARFLLDPRRKHQPTLLSPSDEERAVRRDFLCQCIDVAEALGSDGVSFWSGTPVDDAEEETLGDRIRSSLEVLLERAAKQNIPLALEPEPGMWIDTTAKGQRWIAALDHPMLGLTIDIGHLHCLGEGDVPGLLEGIKDRLWNVHLEDMKEGVHDHLMFGEGEIDFPPIIEWLEANYDRGVYVELSRHAHNAVEIARQSKEFISRLLKSS